MRAILTLLLAAFPARAAEDSYESLLADPAIASAIVWEGTAGPEPYAAWSPAQKQDLAGALSRREADRPAGLMAPPVPILPVAVKTDPVDRAKLGLGEDGKTCEDDGHMFYTASEAWSLYLAHVAHSLWLERHHKVAWSLKDMTPEQRALLLDSRTLEKRKDAEQFEATRFVMGHALSWDPAVAYRFLLKEKMLAPSQRKTVESVTAWANLRLRHISADESFQSLYGFYGPPPIDLIIDRPGPKKVGGCWGVTGFYAAVLRGANIPVVNSQFDAHSRPHFPTADAYLNHGDDIYGSYLAPAGNAVPASEMLLTKEEWERLVVSPAVDCVDGKCNTPAEQADYNIGRRTLLLARKYMTNGLLYTYAKEGPEAVDKDLQGYTVDDKLVTFAKPYFSEAERKAYLAELRAELKRLGGGDERKGGEAAAARVKAFWGR